AEYPHCDGLPHNGSHVIHTARIFNTSCTWHGNPGLQVTLKETLTFQGNLVLKGEIQIMGEQEQEGPCINVSGKMTVIAANASFVGCRNRMQDGKGGALFIQRDFIVSNSGVKFESCRASEGGGLYAGGSLLQEAESTVTFENCTASRRCGGGALVIGNFSQGRKSSAVFHSCSARVEGGGLDTGGSFSQAEESAVTFENCTSFEGGGARASNHFTQRNKSSAIFRNCSASYHGGGLDTGGSFSQEAESTVTFENCLSGGGARVQKTFTQGRNSSAVFRGGGLFTDSFSQAEESTVTCENCWGAGGGARVKENFTQGRKSSAIFRSCSAMLGGGIRASGSYEQEAGSSVLFEHCSADRALAVEAVYREQIGLYVRSLGCICTGGGGLSITGGTVRHDGSVAFEVGFSMAIEALSPNIDLSGQFRKLLFDRCDADVAAAALAAIAAKGAEAELRLEENRFQDQVQELHPATAGLLKLGSVHLSTESSSGTFYANAATRAGFLCPLGTGSVDFVHSHDFGCLACKPGDTQVLNVTSRPAVSRSNGDIHLGPSNFLRTRLFLSWVCCWILYGPSLNTVPPKPKLNSNPYSFVATHSPE
ncbi:unnamed protein product, partial [Symbiodinium sp. KB8]